MISRLCGLVVLALANVKYHVRRAGFAHNRVGSLIALSLFSACMAWVGCAHAGAALYGFASVPGWVKPAPADYAASPPKGDGSGGSWNLVLDRQYNVRADGSDSYQHSVIKITGSGGVDEYSELNLNVDPSYETLDLHSIEVIRDGHASDQLHTARITALPQESELRERIYNGRYNVNVLLSDVRVGDIIDYAYTTHSRERVFPGQFSLRLSIGWSVPMYWQRVRILSPAAHELFYRVTDQQTPPAPTLHGNVREFEWQWHDLPGKPADEDRPRWYSAWPYLQVSSSPSWADVAARAAPLFVVDEPPGAELLKVVADIRKTGGSPEEQALHALQFVQQIRYVSLSIGRGAWQPTSPNTVLSRRFGDCKDKSLLLVTILRQLGIEADPVLVNTRIGRVLNEVLPTPYIFDHAIARVKIGDQIYWTDGTTTEQFSPLTANTTAAYGWVLVLNKGTTALTHVPGPNGEQPSKISEVLIDLSKGMDAPGTLQVTTSYLDRWADNERDTLANDNPEERKSDYANYIAGYYPGAKMSAPLEINDDKARNILEVTEHYDLPQTFEVKNGRKRFFLQADELYRYAGSLKSSVRSSPLAIAYPANVRQTVQVILPNSWDIRDETVQIDNPAFHYVSSVKYSEGGAFPRLVLDYQYRSLSDTVEVGALDQYLQDRRKMDDDLGFYIREPRAPASAVKTTVVAFKTPPVALATIPKWVLLCALLAGAVAVVCHGYPWDPAPKFIDPTWPVGMRGWLILFAVLTALAVISWPFTLWLHAGDLDAKTWGKLSVTTQVILLWFAVVGAVIEALAIFTAYLFFAKRTSAPALIIGTRSAEVMWSFALQMYEATNPLLARHSVGYVLNHDWPALVGLAVWIGYFLKSRRVKATFVRRRQKALEPRPVRFEMPRPVGRSE
jgi:transglutaminase-like putative cysteine protease